MDKHSYPKDKVNILLLENINNSAIQNFKHAGYTNIKSIANALTVKELQKEISQVHILGIRSKTEIPIEAFNATRNLLAIGSYCIGVNHVDLQASAKKGIPVFNAPYSNTRSVAELAIGLIIMLARKIFNKSVNLHQGIWEKSAQGSYEVKGKTLGIIGYGHIGSQVGILAESMGMKVVFYDIAKKLALGAASNKETLVELLKTSDFVTIHVPETEQTKNLILDQEIKLMKKGSCLLNLSRGTVVNLESLKNALVSKHLAGAAIDVFPIEPNSNQDSFNNILQGLPNVILTPHIAGSTEEAQFNIGLEVTDSLIDYLDNGASSSAVNFPKISLPEQKDCHRILNIHSNVPGALSKINTVIADLGINIEAQFLSTAGEIGYLIMDVSRNASSELKQKLDNLDINIKTRLLF